METNWIDDSEDDYGETFNGNGGALKMTGAPAPCEPPE